jgi:hypothetical protein
MPELLPVLRDYDLGLLKIIAELWGVELSATAQREAAEELAAHMLQPEAAAEALQALTPEARAALAGLRRARQPLAFFTRKHGELRAMGPARREREQPWRTEASPAETLWYRGLIARGFFDDGAGPQEFVFIPDDLAPVVPAGEAAPEGGTPPGAPAAAPPAHQRSARDSAAADAATLLSYLQIEPVKLEGAVFPPKAREALAPFLRRPEALDFFTHLVIRLNLAAGMPLKPEPAQARPFLEANFAAQSGQLAGAWRASKEWNDLFHLPGLVCEGKGWRNDPLQTRQALLDLLAAVPPGQWWSLDAFVAAVKDRQPDFQRPAGDYDSWYIRDAATQAYLRGFENWERVDGALIRWLMAGPLFWLGLVDVSSAGSAEHAEKGKAVNSASADPAYSALQAFRVTPYGAAVLGREAWPAPGEAAPIRVGGEAVVRVPASASRYDRFQIARVSHWVALEKDTYLYRLTPASLVRAGQQGIKVSHVLASLQKALGEAPLPPLLVGALKRWERAGAEIALTDSVVLRVKSPDLLETLRRTPKVKRYLGEDLSPTAVEVRRADRDKLREALAELGILVD